MADYVGNYLNDYNRITALAKLQVYLVNGVTFDTSRGTRENTNTDFDNRYLPSIFLNAVEPYQKGNPFCPPNVTLRYAKLYLSTEQYLKVELPFLPGTTQYNQFFIDASFNTDILTIGIEGERINPYYLSFNA
ncbi:MAG: hypothetical protein ACRC2R_16865 [Xenococcaceae cyanobacterium]